MVCSSDRVIVRCITADAHQVFAIDVLLFKGKFFELMPIVWISLSTIVLNSRDWSEIIWLPRNSHFKINLPIGLYPKKPAGMHWLGHNNAVP